jgi:hypothetical protein
MTQPHGQKQELVAPGHVYMPRLGTGIELTQRVAKLWIAGAARAERPHRARTAWEFWYNLMFAEVFPEVDAWWFRDAWSGQVRFSRPAVQQDDATLMGFVQYNGEEGMPWTVSEGDPIQINIPMPLNFVQPVNFPLRLGLACHLLALLNADVSGADLAYDRPFYLRSFVYGQELAETFPTDRRALTASLPLPLTRLFNAADPADVEDVERLWTLEGLDEPIRDAWCASMGLQRPA